MIREKNHNQIIFDLTGPQGNAYFLLGQARVFAKQMNLDVEAIIQNMMSDDYEHLLEVFDSHFGHFVILER